MSWFLSLFVTLIAGVGVLVSGVLTIVKLTGKKKQSAVVPASILVFCILLGALSGLIFMKKTSEKIRRTKETIHDLVKPDTTRTADQVAFMQAIRQMAPEGLRDSIPEAFYNDKKDGYARIPLRYPFSVEMIEFYGDRPGVLSKEGTGALVNNVDRLNFDARWILIRVNNYPEGTDGLASYEMPPYSYYLYDINAGKQLQFTGRDELFKVAYARGYSGDSTLIPVLDMWYKLFD